MVEGAGRDRLAKGGPGLEIAQSQQTPVFPRSVLIVPPSSGKRTRVHVHLLIVTRFSTYYVLRAILRLNI